MHRSLITLLLSAVLMSLCTGSDAKENKELTYDIYGVAHVSVDVLDDGQDSSWYLSSNSSRIGLKGSHLLNDDLKSIWQVECDARLDESGGEFATRNSYVGLSSRYGDVIGGRHDTAFEVLSDQVSLFRDQLGDARNIIGAQGAGWNRRNNNVIAFMSPALNGVSALVMYAPDEEEKQSHLASASVSYRAGGLLLTAAGEMHGKGLTATKEPSYMTVSTDVDPSTGQPLVVEQPATFTPSTESEVGVRLAGSYRRNSLRLTALYEIVDDAGGVSGSESGAWGTGIAYKRARNTFKAQYYATDGLDGVASDGSRMFAFGYDRSLADRAKIYLAYAFCENDAHAASGISSAGRGNGVVPAEGDDPSGLSLGMVCMF